MIPKECKRLAEVDFPIAVVSKHSAREKSIRHGHPSTLHLWWARRPLAACRAMLLALLLPDPCDEHCPEEFRTGAKAALLALPTRPSRWSEEFAQAGPKGNLALRRAMLTFIGDFADWDRSADAAYLKCGRAIVKVAHGEEPPLVVDPFAGGGSIPLESLRLGCDSFASDLNPVAGLIQKVVLEHIPRGGLALSEELRRVGTEIRKTAERQLADVYPADPDGARPIAYLWARTVRCEAPHCGAEIPLLRSLWLCNKTGRKRALRYHVAQDARGIDSPVFEVFTPKRDSEVPAGTVSRAKASCPCCGSVLSPARVRAQLTEQRGGADVSFDANGRRAGGARLMAVVTLRSGQSGRQYRVPTDLDYEGVWRAHLELQQIIDEWSTKAEGEQCPIPNEPLPLMSGTFNVPIYGMTNWGALFSRRQLLGLRKMCDALQSVPSGPVRALLALALGKAADGNNSLCRWMDGYENPVNCFSRQALPMVWDFCESTPRSVARGVFLAGIGDLCQVIDTLADRIVPGQVQQADARHSPLPSDSVACWFSDPPYYFAIPYADLSDFFLVWLNRSLGREVSSDGRFETLHGLAPKNEELCEMAHWDKKRYAHKDHRYFESGMAVVFAEACRVLNRNGIGSVVFAHKTTEGWEALLGGIVGGGLTITGSWPISTESPTRLRARESAALATSVHLVFRPRAADAPVGDWGDVVRELPRRVTGWMERLESEGIRGADLVFACIGPALEIYSRYSKVVDPQEREIPLGGDPEAKEPHKRGYLAYVWETVGRVALEQVLGTEEAKARNGAAGALEEDARLTALFLWTLQATDAGEEGNGKKGKGMLAEEAGDDGDEVEVDEDDDGESGGRGGKGKKGKKGFSLVYDVARRFAQPLGIHLDVWEGRIIETDKGVVRLIPVLERAEQLFGSDGAGAIADRLEKGGDAAAAQMSLFPEGATAPKVKGRGRGGRKKKSVNDEDLHTPREATTLDRVHAAMLLQAGGRSNALRALLKAETQRGPDFVRLANSLSALYPQGSDEERLLDAMLLAVPR